MIRSWAVATPHCRAGVSSGSSSSANGQDNAPWKMLPAVIASVRCKSRVVVVSMHGRPWRRSSARPESARPERNSATPAPTRSAGARSCVGVGTVEQRVRCVQAEHRHRLSTRVAQPGRQDARVGQRMAVRLARQRIRQLPAAAREYAVSSWVHVSLTWNVPANACSGVTLSSRNRGSRRNTMLTLTCAPGASGGAVFAQQAGQDRRRDAGQHEPAPDRGARRRRCGSAPRRPARPRKPLRR